MLSPRPFFFLRHGETDWNAAGRTQGRTDVPLNARGIAQAEHAAGLLVGHDIIRIVCSTLGRAQHTARIVGAALGLPFTCDADLQEASFGVQEGKPMGTWYDDWVTGETTPDSAESFAAVTTRVVPAINRAVNAPGLALAVGHGAMFRAVRTAMGLSALVRTENGVPLRCDPGAPWQVTPVGS